MLICGVKKEDIQYLMNHNLMGFIWLIMEGKAKGECLHPGPISNNFKQKLLNKKEKVEQIWKNHSSETRIQFKCDRLLQTINSETKKRNKDKECEDNCMIEVFDVTIPNKRKKN